MCGLLLALSMIYLSSFFGVGGMSVQCVLLCVNFAIIAEPMLRYLTIFVEGVRKVFSKIEK
jgi:cation-transporting ATPase E